MIDCLQNNIFETKYKTLFSNLAGLLIYEHFLLRKLIFLQNISLRIRGSSKEESQSKQKGMNDGTLTKNT